MEKNAENSTHNPDPRFRAVNKLTVGMAGLVGLLGSLTLLQDKVDALESGLRKLASTTRGLFCEFRIPLSQCAPIRRKDEAEPNLTPESDCEIKVIHAINQRTLNRIVATDALDLFEEAAHECSTSEYQRYINNAELEEARKVKTRGDVQRAYDLYLDAMHGVILIH